MTINTMQWIRSVRDKIWEDTKGLPSEERQRYFETKRNITEEKISQIKTKKHTSKR